MPKGVYQRTEKHREICRKNGIKNGLASTTKFKKGHKQIPWNKGLTKETDERVRKLSESPKRRKKIGESTKGKNNPAWIGGEKGYYRNKAKLKLFGNRNPNNGFVVHHIDGNVKNNKIENLQIMTRSGHTKLHWQQGDIR